MQQSSTTDTKSDIAPLPLPPATEALKDDIVRGNSAEAPGTQHVLDTRGPEREEHAYNSPQLSAVYGQKSGLSARPRGRLLQVRHTDLSVPTTFLGVGTSASGSAATTGASLAPGGAALVGAAATTSKLARLANGGSGMTHMGTSSGALRTGGTPGSGRKAPTVTSSGTAQPSTFGLIQPAPSLLRPRIVGPFLRHSLSSSGSLVDQGTAQTNAALASAVSKNAIVTASPSPSSAAGTHSSVAPALPEDVGGKAIVKRVSTEGRKSQGSVASSSGGNNPGNATPSEKIVTVTPAGHSCTSYSNPPCGMLKTVLSIGEDVSDPATSMAATTSSNGGASRNASAVGRTSEGDAGGSLEGDVVISQEVPGSSSEELGSSAIGAKLDVHPEDIAAEGTTAAGGNGADSGGVSGLGCASSSDSSNDLLTSAACGGGNNDVTAQGGSCRATNYNACRRPTSASAGGAEEIRCGGPELLSDTNPEIVAEIKIVAATSDDFRLCVERSQTSSSVPYFRKRGGSETASPVHMEDEDVAKSPVATGAAAASAAVGSSSQKKTYRSGSLEIGGILQHEQQTANRPAVVSESAPRHHRPQLLQHSPPVLNAMPGSEQKLSSRTASYNTAFTGAGLAAQQLFLQMKDVTGVGQQNQQESPLMFGHHQVIDSMAAGGGLGRVKNLMSFPATRHEKRRLHEEVVAQAMQGKNLRSCVDTLVKPYVIGVCGATCSGKTTLCDIFRRELRNYLRVAFIPSDAFYKDLDETQKKLANAAQYDFDHPDAIAWDEMLGKIKTLKRGFESVEIPRYDFKTHSRLSKTATDGVKGGHAGGEIIKPADVIIVEGILIYAVGPELRSELDLKIFIDCDSDVRLARRLQRDIVERGRECNGILTQYMKFVKPSYDNFIEPSKRYADVIIPNTKEREMETNNAIAMMVQHIKHQLEKRNSARKLTRGMR
ncbi:unnamed protein product [Amoebophrya sp. A25]|nr:unnamed protein product [Amoebophrya sp. A25]|eukprot:GSA25T00004243001.1